MSDVRLVPHVNNSQDLPICKRTKYLGFGQGAKCQKQSHFVLTISRCPRLLQTTKQSEKKKYIYIKQPIPELSLDRHQNPTLGARDIDRGSRKTRGTLSPRLPEWMKRFR